MIEQFESLNEEERALLLKAPALVSILASSTDQEMDETEKADAIKLSHLRTFTADPMLRPYYQEVEKAFKAQLVELLQLHNPLNEYSRKAIEREIKNVNKLLGRLDKKFAEKLGKSLNSYAEHVNKSKRNFMEYFVLPLNIPGITD